MTLAEDKASVIVVPDNYQAFLKGLSDATVAIEASMRFPSLSIMLVVIYATSCLVIVNSSDIFHEFRHVLVLGSCDFLHITSLGLFALSQSCQT